MGELAPPVDEGEQFNLTIEEWGKFGDGMAFIEGFAIIVEGYERDDPATAIGESVQVEIVEVSSSFAKAEPVENGQQPEW